MHYKSRCYDNKVADNSESDSFKSITKHLANIFKSGELNQNSVSSILEHTASDGKTYKTQFYNLDAILSVGYRVNSVNATRFRQWANKEHDRFLIIDDTVYIPVIA